MTSSKKQLSIISVSYNSLQDLMCTIQSVNSQSGRALVDYIVVDGGSNDGTLEYLKTSNYLIETFISEPDINVYHAMNKGLAKTTTEWIYFLNAGDVFYSEQTLSQILDTLNSMDQHEVLYSDVIVNSTNKNHIFSTNFEEKTLNHQGFVYKKELHNKFGMYTVIRGFTAADFLFFLQMDGVNAKKLETPIAIFQAGGLSSTVNAVYQKYCLDFISGRVSAFYLVAILLFYPVYRLITNGYSKLVK